MNPLPKNLPARRPLSSFVFAAGCALGGTAGAASFDCDTARTDVDTLVCMDEHLSELDEHLNLAYRRAVRLADSPAAMLRSQREWYKRRDACVVAECVRQAYRDRLAVLAPLGLPAPTPWVRPVTGAYEFRDTGVLYIQQHGHDRIRFELHTRYSWDRGTIFGDASLVDQVAVFASPADECGMSFRFGHERVTVEQTGVCGMQGRTTANGTYLKLNAIPPGL